MMKNMKKMLLLGVMVLAMGASTVTAFAADTPANSATSLDELKAQRLELHKEILADRVKAGLITQEQADAIIDQIEENQAVCDGTGSYGYGRRMGLGAGYGIGGCGAGGCGGGYGMMRGLNQ